MAAPLAQATCPHSRCLLAHTSLQRHGEEFVEWLEGGATPGVEAGPQGALGGESSETMLAAAAAAAEQQERTVELVEQNRQLEREAGEARDTVLLYQRAVASLLEVALGSGEPTVAACAHQILASCPPAAAGAVGVSPARGLLPAGAGKQLSPGGLIEASHSSLGGHPLVALTADATGASGGASRRGSRSRRGSVVDDDDEISFMSLSASEDTEAPSREGRSPAPSVGVLSLRWAALPCLSRCPRLGWAGLGWEGCGLPCPAWHLVR